METKIIESSELPLGEKVYLKKGWTGWRVIEPIKDPVTGKFIWKNFFSKKGFVQLAVIIIILAVGYLAFREALINYQTVLEAPCNFCKNITIVG